jgi:aarF domain-containing kinase
MFQPFLDRIPPRPPTEIREVIEGELQQPLESLFSQFEETPIGCASIGQTHRAVLRSIGERVVVKVQNPEAERTFRGDVFALKVLVDIFAPQLSSSFDEIQRQFATEFDYRREAANAAEIRENLRRSGKFPNVLVPRVYASLCSKRMMVMEEIFPCTPLHQALDAQAGIIARQRGVSKEEFIEAEKARVETEAREAAAHGRLVRQLSANTYDRYIAVQQTKRSWSRAWRRVYNWTVGVATLGRSRYDLDQDDTLVPINAAKLVDDLLAVTAHEVLIDGCFNADPHPGNILYIDSTPPKLGLIDYGQVKRLTDRQRYDLARAFLLVEAALEVDPKVNPSVDLKVHKRARESVGRHMLDRIGLVTKHRDPDVAYQQATVFLGRMDAAFLYPLNVLQWSDMMEAADPLVDISACDFLVTFNLTTMMIRGLGEMMQQNRNLAKAWASVARQALSEQPGMLQEVEDEIRSWREPQC